MPTAKKPAKKPAAKPKAKAKAPAKAKAKAPAKPKTKAAPKKAEKSPAWRAIHSSENDTWRTPKPLFDRLNREFGFELDAAALKHTALLDSYYGPDHENGSRTDALALEDWEGQTIFVNPPYGRKVGDWVKKGWEESLKGKTVVMLVMACTDTIWWHNWAWQADQIRLMKGRVPFRREDGSKASSAPKGSAILVFRPSNGKDHKKYISWTFDRYDD
jgi:site-specific DNA-methyltransferase (adenine-specific)